MELEALVQRVAQLEELVGHLVKWTNFSGTSSNVNDSRGASTSMYFNPTQHHHQENESDLRHNRGHGGDEKDEEDGQINNVVGEQIVIFPDTANYLGIRSQFGFDSVLGGGQGQMSISAAGAAHNSSNLYKQNSSKSTNSERTSAKPHLGQGQRRPSTTGIAPSKHGAASLRSKGAKPSTTHQCCYCGEQVTGGALIFRNHIRQYHPTYVNNIGCVGCGARLASLYGLRRHHNKCDKMVGILHRWQQQKGRMKR